MADVCDAVMQLQTRVDQLTKLNNDHRRRSSLTRRQAQQLIEDKAELQALLHDRDQEISHIRDRLKRYSRDAAVDALTSQVSNTLCCCLVLYYPLWLKHFDAVFPAIAFIRDPREHVLCYTHVSPAFLTSCNQI